jgi:chromosome segregation ATPase
MGPDHGRGEEARRRIKQLEEESVKVLKRDADVEKELEEKSEQIRELENLVAEYQSKQSTGVSEEELVALHGELERERQTMDEDRQSMEEQFRQLELSMARERAEIARERNELQRTKTELKLKLDTLEKSVQNDMSPLRRLREELRGEQAPQPPGSGPLTRPNQAGLPAMPTLPALNRRAPESEDTPKRSGILSRFLGKRDE